MRKLLFLALLICLVACAARYGNFMRHTTQANDKKMADDVAKKLVTLYPPALTRFDLQHAATDYFGTSLIAAMRTKGYAVLEYKARRKKGRAGVPLAYAVDELKGTGLYRVTVLIDRQQSLNRVYKVAKDGVLHPAGYWVRKE